MRFALLPFRCRPNPLLLALFLGGFAGHAQITVRPSRTTLPIYQKLEVRVETGKSYANPFDPAEVKVEGLFTAPSGKVSTVSGFWFQDFAVDHAAKAVRATGAPHFRLRFTPVEVGTYRCTVRVTDQAGTQSSQSHQVRTTQAAPGTKGFVRVHPRQPNRYYRDFSGESFFVIGFNADLNTFYRPFDQGYCWDSTAGSRYFPSATHASGNRLDEKALYRNYANYVDVLTKSAQAGANALRLFNDAYYTPIEIDQDMDVPGYGKKSPGFEVGKYHLGMCWLIDQLYETAERHHVAIRHTVWAGNPNINWGGRQYAVAENEALMKRRIGYQLARWGHSPSYWATTYFNEWGKEDKSLPNPTSDFWKNLTAWLREQDPYGHLVSNNVTPYNGNVTAGGIDDYAPHFYTTDVRPYTAWQTDATKPMIYEEFGASHTICKVPLDFDPEARYPRMGFFQSLLGNRSGGLTWWIKPYYGYLNLYEPMYRGIANFLRGEDLVKSGPWQKVAVEADTAQFYAANAMATERGDRVFVYVIRSGPDQGQTPRADSGSPLKLRVAKGRYRLEWWDPMKGTKTSDQTLTTEPDGSVTLRLPATTSADWAAKLVAVR